MSARAITRALARARRAVDALDARVVRVARVAARPPDVESASRRALRTCAASEATVPWALRALADERGSVASTAGGATRAYSKKKGKKQGKEERGGAAASAADESEDEGEGDDEDDAGEEMYDPKVWQRCVRERVDARGEMHATDGDALGRSKFESALHALDTDLSHLRTARASEGMIDHIMVEVYGAPTPLSHLGTITAPNAQTLSVTLFDQSTKSSVEKAILNSPLGLVPRATSDGFSVPIPAMTQDTRKEVCKLAHKLGETAKIAARNIRHKALKHIKRSITATDEVKRAEKALQSLADDITSKITQRVAAKDKEIMTL